MVPVQRRFGINLAWNTLNTWGVSALTVASTVVYARLLASEQWGVYATFTWLVTSFALLITVGWNLTINKFVAQAVGMEQRQRAAQIFRTVLTIEVVGVTCLGALMLAGAHRIAATLERPDLVRAMPYIVAGMFAMIFFTTCNMGLIALQQYRVMSIVALFTASVALTSGTIWLRHDGGPRGLLMIVALANAANATLSLVLIGRSLPLWSAGRPARGVISELTRYCLSATLLVILMQIVYERAEIFFLSRSQSASDVGFYSLAVAMTNVIITSVPNVVIGPLLAMTADLHARNDHAGLRALYDSATRLLFLIAPPVAVGGAIVARPLIALMYGPQSSPVGTAAMLLLPPAVMLVIAKPATSLLWGMGKQGKLIAPLAFGAALNLTLDAIIIPRYGLYGAVLGSSFAQVVATILTTIVCLRFLHFTFPWRRLFRTCTAALAMIPFVLLPSIWLTGAVLIGAQIFLGAVTYPLGLILFGVVDPETLALITGRLHRLPRPLQQRLSVFLGMLGDRH